MQEFKPHNLESWLDTGQAFFFSGNYEEALAAYEKSIEIKPDEQSVLIGKWFALEALDQAREARRVFSQATQLGIPLVKVRKPTFSWKRFISNRFAYEHFQHKFSKIAKSIRKCIKNP